MFISEPKQVCSLPLWGYNAERQLIKLLRQNWPRASERRHPELPAKNVKSIRTRDHLPTLFQLMYQRNTALVPLLRHLRNEHLVCENENVTMKMYTTTRLSGSM
jgi:hypothetical protein